MQNVNAATALIALGANLGDADDNIRAALKMLNDDAEIEILKTSSFIKTAPVGGPSGQPDYTNGAVLVRTSMEPVALLHRLQEIERTLHRVRLVRWGARTIDLDLILYGDKIVLTPELTIPHPRVYWRQFVLDPANEIAPAATIPTSCRTISETRRLLFMNFRTFDLLTFFLHDSLLEKSK